jgi:hypothetical protein
VGQYLRSCFRLSTLLFMVSWCASLMRTKASSSCRPHTRCHSSHHSTTQSNHVCLHYRFNSHARSRASFGLQHVTTLLDAQRHGLAVKW